MRKVLAVARWEYVEKLKSKAFLIGLFLTPLIMIGMGVLPTIFVTEEDDAPKTIGIIDETGEFFTPVAQRAEQRFRLKDGQPNYIVLPLAVGTGIDVDEEVERADARAGAGDIEGFFVIRRSVDSDSMIQYRSKVVGDLRIPFRFEEMLRELITERRSKSLGVSADVLRNLTVTMDVKVQKLSDTGAEQKGGFETVFLSAYAFLMMFFFLIATSGQLLVRSMLSEKTNRIVEVLVSSSSPTEMMTGKVLGLSALALTQMAFWGLIGIYVAAQFGVVLIDPSNALLLSVYFILGYLFYAAVFIAAGSPLNTEQEAQQVTSYLMLLLILPIILAIPAMKAPDALWLKIMTYVPFLTPTMMALRVPIQPPPPWEIIVTIMLLVVSTYLAMVMAGRIFRIAILSTGKTPTLSEIVQWVRKG